MPSSLAYNRIRHASFRLYTILLGMLFTLASLTSAAEVDAALGQAQQPPPIQIIPGDSMNLKIVEQISSHYVVVQVDPPVHNWFAGTFTNLPTDKEVTIGLSMVGMDSKGNKADVSKWRGIMPVMTYADPEKYETYEWFSKDEQGRWVSCDPFKQGRAAQYAGNGKVPEQSVIPKEFAKQFLSADGKYWSAWREVDKAEAITTLNIFRCASKFALPEVTIAMRVPFTYTYQQQVIARLQAAKLPGVFVDEIGTTPGGRKLQVIRVENTSPGVVQTKKKTAMVIAREHATEHASSWAAFGILAEGLNRLYQHTIQPSDPTWLFVLIEDPDGATASIFDRMTEKFLDSDEAGTPPEVFDYARYMIDYVNSKQTIDISVAFHNVEANETPHLFSPFRERIYDTETLAFNRQYFALVSAENYSVASAEKSWGVGGAQNRLYGWCSRFGAFDLAYEVNDRNPSQRLSLQQLQHIGSLLQKHVLTWLPSTEGETLHNRAHALLEERSIKRAAYFEQHKDASPDHRTQYEMLILRY